MPILRFSYAGGRLCAPDEAGRWHDGAYDPDAKTGLLFDLNCRPETLGAALRAELPGDLNHWVYFTDPGNAALLRHLLRGRESEAGLAALRAQGGVEGLVG